MNIVDHPGFRRALSECDLTAFEANALEQSVAALEGFFAGLPQSQTVSGLKPEPSRRDPEACPTYRALPSETYIASELLRMLSTLSGNPLPSQASLTSGEIMARDLSGVQS